MSAVAERVIAGFESLPAEEKQAVAKEILRRLRLFDSGPLDDNEVAHAGDQLAAMLEDEENGTSAR
jgi:hypothetical protein